MAETKILWTNNYGLFVISDFNRDVKKTRYLEASMTKYDYIGAFPLFVVKREDGKLVIKEGHHRFVVARSLKLDVAYTIVTGKAAEMTQHEIVRSHNPHTMQDYLVSHIRAGKRDYILVQDYHVRTGIPLSASLALCYGYTSAHTALFDKFKEGSYKVGSMVVANFVADIVAHAKGLNLPFATNIYFIRAVGRLAHVKECNPRLLKDRMKSNRAMMIEMVGLTTEQYSRMLDNVYNKGTRNRDKVNLDWLAKQEANRRTLGMQCGVTGNGKKPAKKAGGKKQEEKGLYGQDRANQDQAVYGAGEPGDGAGGAAECGVGAQ